VNNWKVGVPYFLSVSLAVILLSTGPAAAGDAGALYKSKCAGCHGPDGKGATGAGKALGAHDFASSEIQKMSDAELEQIISQGKNKMPAYGNKLSATEIKDLVEYIRGFAKK